MLSDLCDLGGFFSVVQRSRYKLKIQRESGGG
jgi:hypothetical protein